jgi:hypothetical protein
LVAIDRIISRRQYISGSRLCESKISLTVLCGRLLCQKPDMFPQTTRHQVPGESKLNSHLCHTLRYHLLVLHDKAALQNTANIYENLIYILLIYIEMSIRNFL